MISKKRLPYLLLAPAVAAELVIHVVPMLAGLGMSLLKLTQFFLRDWTRAPFAGLGNFAVAVDVSAPVGADLLRSFCVTLLYAVLVVTGSWALGMLGAVLLRRPFPGRGALRALFLVPFALPVFTGVITWSFMLQRDTGLVNAVLDADAFWLIGGNSFASLVVVTIWRSWSFAFLTLTAGLAAVPPELHEAADVDGAGRWRRFRSVTLPQLAPVNRVLVLVLFLWTFNEFTTPYTLFGKVAPEEASVLSIHVYNASFSTWNLGLGSAMSVLLLLFLLLVSLGYLWLTSRRRRVPGV
ncbi:carbohydrate ABC transporter permease [Nonomuraea pusilla]|uniref:Carbohydrate ABC transporter membrane protein 1, CUT1 family (TC 3.A.1.1.-) n=1 Tax=Nonomuraea pusilla TaxID=46177 RepID=A0A1H8JN21_9ACTN|nr:sugar ABC transporter permease [Nonomuraea pusilla]SEN82134.1 carbohydrate ABC transporter membrane protein 1, CUT1 family (TC 3.A.1.1.-) [Nonomuraea pusilla]